MKYFTVLLLAVSLMVIYAEARPSPEDDFKEVQAQVLRAVGKLKEALDKVRAKFRKSVKEYFAEDGLGDKIKAVLEILSKRFAKRIEAAVNKME